MSITSRALTTLRYEPVQQIAPWYYGELDRIPAEQVISLSDLAFVSVIDERLALLYPG